MERAKKQWPRIDHLTTMTAVLSKIVVETHVEWIDRCRPSRTYYAARLMDVEENLEQVCYSEHLRRNIV